MVSKDMTMSGEAENERKRPSLLWPLAIVLATVFAMGVAAGYLDAHRDAGGSGPSALIGGGVVLLAGLAALGLYLRRFGTFWHDWSRRKRLYVGSLIGSGLLGLISAILIRSGQVGDFGGDPFFSNSPLTPGVAMILALLWSVGISIAVIVYQRSVDDHEKQAYLWAGLAGYYAFIVPAPAWWVLARADLVPPVDAMLLFVLTIMVNAVVYLWLKFR